MGALSSCCVEERPSVYQEAYSRLRDRLRKQSLPVVVPLADGTNLDCSLGLVRIDGRRQFVLSTADRVRQIPLEDCSALLTLPEELQRIDSAARITSDLFVAIRLKKGNCIPLR